MCTEECYHFYKMQMCVYLRRHSGSTHTSWQPADLAGVRAWETERTRISPSYFLDFLNFVMQTLLDIQSVHIIHFNVKSSVDIGGLRVREEGRNQEWLLKCLVQELGRQ